MYAHSDSENQFCLLCKFHITDSFLQLNFQKANSQPTNSIIQNIQTGGVIQEMHELYSTILNANKSKSVVSAKRLMNYVYSKNEMLEQHYHQDCHQFFIWLVNEVNDELIHKAKSQKYGYNQKDYLTVLQKDMFGVQTTRTTCLKCKSVSERDELQVDLSLHIPEPNMTLSECIKNFSAKEGLREENKFFCDVCRCLQNAQKTTLLKTLPRYLTIHLKRFKYDERIKGLSKINSQVTFPFQLKLKTVNRQ